MFRVLDFPTAAGPISSEGAGNVEPPPPGTLRWVDVEKPDDAELALLQERFAFHPLAIEDCSHFDQRPKLEEYADHIFVVVHSFVSDGPLPTYLAPRELHAFLGGRSLVTVHDDRLAPLDAVWKRLANDSETAWRGVDFVYYLLLDGVVDSTFPLLDALSDRLEEVEDAVLTHRAGDLGDIFRLKQALVTMRRFLSPQRDVVGVLVKRGAAQVSERTALYFRDVYDHLVRIYEAIDAARDLLGNVLDAHLSLAAARTNDIMKRLTILSAIFLPLSFVVGFFGQNFTHMPFDSLGFLFVMLASCVVIPAGMLYLFWRSRYL